MFTMVLHESVAIAADLTTFLFVFLLIDLASGITLIEDIQGFIGLTRTGGFIIHQPANSNNDCHDQYNPEKNTDKTASMTEADTQSAIHHCCHPQN